jgi:hypothetical protein
MQNRARKRFHLHLSQFNETRKLIKIRSSPSHEEQTFASIICIFYSLYVRK